MRLMALGIVVVAAAPLVLGATGFAVVKGYKIIKLKNKKMKWPLREGGFMFCVQIFVDDNAI